MGQTKLDTISLTNAISQLEDCLDFYLQERQKNDTRLVKHLLSAVIQNFEFTYELSWKMLKRYLHMTSPDPDEIEAMSFQNLIRTGCEQGILKSDVAQWMKYRHNRSITSHTYDKDKAEIVFNAIPDFLSDAQFLLEQLNMRAGGL